MKRLLIFMATALICISAVAQKKMSIGALFDGRYHSNPDVKEVFIKGDMLDSYDLDVYRSLTFTDMPEEAPKIVAFVVKDGASANDKEVVYRDGGLYYGFYQFLRPGGNRYIFYLNQNLNAGNQIILIYMEGMASPKTIRKMIK